MSTLALWKSKKIIDPILKKDLLKKDKILSRFFNEKTQLNSGVIYGKMGAGTSNINEFTIGALAKAYVDFLKIKNNKKKINIVISYDNRVNSKLYADIISSILEENKINTYIFKEGVIPSPIVSYTINRKKLDGGIIVTASKKNKNFNGMQILDQTGGVIERNTVDIINRSLDKINPLKVKRGKVKNLLLSDDLIDEYLQKILEVRLNKTTEKSLKVVYTSHNGSSSNFAPKIFNSIGIDYNLVKKQANIDSSFKYTKITNPENGKSFKKAEWLARRVSADIMMSTDTDGGRLALAVKYKKRWKFLSSNDAATIYLDYKLSYLKSINQLPKNSYIVVNELTSSLLEKIAHKYNVKVYKISENFNGFSELIETKKDETFLFGCDQSYGYIFDEKLSKIPDSFQTMIAYIDMANHFKNNKVNLFKKLKDIFGEWGIHRTTKIEKKLNKSKKRELFRKILRAKSIQGYKVEKIIDLRKNKEKLNPIVKTIFQNGSWIAVEGGHKNSKVNIFIENVGKKQDTFVDVVAFEKEINEWVEDNIEEINDKQFSWKAVLKYSIFLTILVLIFVFVFNIVYSTNKTTGGTIPVFTVAQAVVYGFNRWLWLTLWGWLVFNNFLSAWVKKRMFQRLNQKVKIGHLVISSMMSWFIAFVTPFAIGGDAIGYWYLRKKGVHRASIIATLSSTILWGQVKFVLQTLVLIGFGWKLYVDIFNRNDIQANAAFTWFIVGSCWSLFATFMIGILTLNVTFQEFIIRNTTKILEWLPFVHIYDPGRHAASAQHEFKQIRVGMRRLWNKWWFVLEIFFYDMIPLFVSPYSMILASKGFINSNVSTGTYWSQIITNDIINTANSMSITPGGTGTSEWLNIVIKETLYGHSEFANANQLSGATLASGMDFAYKIMITWPNLIISLLFIFIVILTVRNKELPIFIGYKRRVIYAATTLLCLTMILSLIIFI